MIYTTYFAKIKKLPIDIVPISIAQFPPKDIKILEYKSLAPSPKLLSAYKTTGDWTAYVNTYDLTVLAKLDPHKTVTDLCELTHNHDFAMVCFEKDWTRCHRTLVAEWLKENGYDVTEFQA